MLGIAGADAAFFAILNSKLLLKTGTVLNANAKSSYSVQITVDDATIGNGIDSSVSFALNITAMRTQILAPPSQTQSQRPVLTWTAVAGAVNYEVWINNASTGVAKVYHTIVNATSHTPNIDLGIGRFHLWVRSINGSGVWSAWTPRYEFTINTPAVLLPVDRYQPTLRPQIGWSTLPGAVKYDVWISDTTRGISPVVRSSNVVRTSYVPTADLPLGTYRVWVRGIATDGTFGTWSLGAEFLTLKAPTITGPLNFTFNRRPVFTWNSLAGAASYELQLKNINSGVTIYNVKRLTATNWTPPANLPNGSYRWWVIGIGPSNLRSNWTAPADLNIGGATSVIGPVGTINSHSPVFTWKPVDGVSRYELWVTDTIRNVVAINKTDLTSTNYTHTASLASGAYRVWVRAVSTAGESGAWSSSADFVIAGITDHGEVDPERDSPIAVKLNTQLRGRIIRHAFAVSTDSSERNADDRDLSPPQIPEPDDFASTAPMHSAGMDVQVADSTQEDWYDQVMEQFLETDFTMLTAD